VDLPDINVSFTHCSSTLHPPTGRVHRELVVTWYPPPWGCPRWGAAYAKNALRPYLSTSDVGRRNPLEPSETSRRRRWNGNRWCGGKCAPATRCRQCGSRRWQRHRGRGHGRNGSHRYRVDGADILGHRAGYPEAPSARSARVIALSTLPFHPSHCDVRFWRGRRIDGQTATPAAQSLRFAQVSSN
jgi:hypothetical protein